METRALELADANWIAILMDFFSELLSINISVSGSILAWFKSRFWHILVTNFWSARNHLDTQSRWNIRSRRALGREDHIHQGQVSEVRVHCSRPFISLLLSHERGSRPWGQSVSQVSVQYLMFLTVRNLSPLSLRKYLTVSQFWSLHILSHKKIFSWLVIHLSFSIYFLHFCVILLVK